MCEVKASFLFSSQLLNRTTPAGLSLNVGNLMNSHNNTTRQTCIHMKNNAREMGPIMDSTSGTIRLRKDNQTNFIQVGQTILEFKSNPVV